MNDSATGVQYVDYNSSPSECANSPGGGGNWVPPGFGYHVDPVSGTLFTYSASMPPPGTYGDYLACAYLQWDEIGEETLVANVAPFVAFGRGGPLAGWGVLLGVTAPWDISQSLRINVTCSQQVYGR